MPLAPQLAKPPLTTFPTTPFAVGSAGQLLDPSAHRAVYDVYQAMGGTTALGLGTLVSATAAFFTHPPVLKTDFVQRHLEKKLAQAKKDPQPLEGLRGKIRVFNSFYLAGHALTTGAILLALGDHNPETALALSSALAAAWTGSLSVTSLLTWRAFRNAPEFVKEPAKQAALQELSPRVTALRKEFETLRHAWESVRKFSVTELEQDFEFTQYALEALELRLGDLRDCRHQGKFLELSGKIKEDLAQLRLVLDRVKAASAERSAGWHGDRTRFDQALAAQRGRS